MRWMRMHGYYFGFDETGAPEIDNVLSAVACAGKAYHHTEGWCEKSDPYEPTHRGTSPVYWIQNAANDARDAMRSLRADRDELLALLRRVVESTDAFELGDYSAIDAARAALEKRGGG